jgi:hypothetical protein
MRARRGARSVARGHYRKLKPSVTVSRCGWLAARVALALEILRVSLKRAAGAAESPA